MPSSPPEPSASLIDNRYRLERQLGKGAMGTVWQAFDSRLKRRVALKQLHYDGDASPELSSELQALARLSHPNVVNVLDSGRMPDGAPFLAMELVVGMTLKEELARTGKLPVARGCRIGSQVVRALIGAHAEGVVHRDLKPSNIMLSDSYGERDVVKLVDFGIARLLDSTRTSLTGSRFVGTPQYASPEQAQGRVTTPSSDLYSLGVVLHEALSGRPLFQAETHIALLFHHVHTLPQRLSALEECVPAWLDELVWCMLEKEPNERPKHAREVLDCFEHARGPKRPEPASAVASVRVPAQAAMPASLQAIKGTHLLRRRPAKRRAVVAMVVIPAAVLSIWRLASQGAPPAELPRADVKLPTGQEGLPSSAAPGSATKSDEAVPSNDSGENVPTSSAAPASPKAAGAIGPNANEPSGDVRRETRARQRKTPPVDKPTDDGLPEFKIDDLLEPRRLQKVERQPKAEDTAGSAPTVGEPAP